MKYRIKEYEALVTRYKSGQWAKEQIETRYQIEMRAAGFWGWLWGWEEIGATFDTQEEARERIVSYKRSDGPRFGERKAKVRYINVD